MAFHSLMAGTSLWGCGGWLLVELGTAEVHQRVAEQLDLDAVGVLEVHRLGDAEVGPGVLDAGLVQPSLALLPAVPRAGDRNVLDAADRLDDRLEPQPG